MCIDFTNLNFVCPKDNYPLFHIDILIDSVVGYSLMSFVDAFFDYHQIKMHPTDYEKTIFITHKGVYWYTIMTFGLQNAGATYQRLMDII